MTISGTSLVKDLKVLRSSVCDSRVRTDSADNPSGDWKWAQVSQKENENGRGSCAGFLHYHNMIIKLASGGLTGQKNF